jgi:hypothetical protein
MYASSLRSMHVLMTNGYRSPGQLEEDPRGSTYIMSTNGPCDLNLVCSKDPNATSAWNAVITGSKGWIFFPPEIVPPGIFVSEGAHTCNCLPRTVCSCHR